jgi:hypothetical protein
VTALTLAAISSGCAIYEASDSDHYAYHHSLPPVVDDGGPTAIQPEYPPPDPAPAVYPPPVYQHPVAQLPSRPPVDDNPPPRPDYSQEGHLDFSQIPLETGSKHKGRRPHMGYQQQTSFSQGLSSGAATSSDW